MRTSIAVVSGLATVALAGQGWSSTAYGSVTPYAPSATSYAGASLSQAPPIWNSCNEDGMISMTTIASSSIISSFTKSSSTSSTSMDDCPPYTLETAVPSFYSELPASILSLIPSWSGMPPAGWCHRTIPAFPSTTSSTPVITTTKTSIPSSGVKTTTATNPLMPVTTTTSSIVTIYTDECPPWTLGTATPSFFSEIPASALSLIPSWTGAPPAGWCHYTFSGFPSGTSSSVVSVVSLTTSTIKPSTVPFYLTMSSTTTSKMAGTRPIPATTPASSSTTPSSTTSTSGCSLFWGDFDAFTSGLPTELFSYFATETDWAIPNTIPSDWCSLSYTPAAPTNSSSSLSKITAVSVRGSTTPGAPGGSTTAPAVPIKSSTTPVAPIISTTTPAVPVKSSPTPVAAVSSPTSNGSSTPVVPYKSTGSAPVVGPGSSGSAVKPTGTGAYSAAGATPVKSTVAQFTGTAADAKKASLFIAGFVAVAILVLA